MMNQTRKKGWRGEHYVINDNGSVKCNVQYNVVFPHDKDYYDSVEKYKRRFERLKNIIIDNKTQSCFIYSSQSSLEKGHFTLNGNEVITEVYLNINKINNLLKKYNNNFRIVIFDSILNDNISILVQKSI